MRPTAKLNLMKKPLRLAETETLRKLLPKEFIKEKTKEKQFLTRPAGGRHSDDAVAAADRPGNRKAREGIRGLIEEIEGYEAILAKENVLMDIIREDITEMKNKYGDKRRTKITSRQAETFDLEDLIADEEVIVTVSHAGYVKRMPIDTYRKQGRGGTGVIGSDTKEGDFIEHMFTASTHDYLLIFTNRGKCYWLKVYDIPSLTRQSRGRSPSPTCSTSATRQSPRSLTSQKLTKTRKCPKTSSRSL